MKLHNGDSTSFVITSNDVFVNNQSSMLTDVIESQNDKLTSLEKNVKWLYKYGGTGSKGGGSGSGSGYTKFKIDANVLFGNNIIRDSKSITNQKVILSDNSKTYETLSISMNSVNILNVYNVTISHAGNIIKDSSTGNRYWVLNQENDFSINVNVPLADTAEFNITITGTSGVTGDSDRSIYIFTYIKNPYVINLSLLDNKGNQILQNDNLYVNDALNNGVNFYLDYNIASSKAVSYEIINDEDILTSYSGIINDIEHGTGLGSLTIPFNNEFLSSDDNYGYHTINIKLKIDPDESIGILNGQIITKNISFTYIPNDQIFFKIEPANNNAKIYKFSENGYNNAVLNLNKYKRYYNYFTELDNEKIIEASERNQLINELFDDVQTEISDSQLKEALSNELTEIETNLYIFNVGSIQLYIQAYFGSNVLNSVDVLYLASTDINDNEGHELLASLQYRKRQMVNIPVHEEGIYRLCIYSNSQNVEKRIYYYFAAFDRNNGINWFNTNVINNINKVDFYYREGKIGSHTPINNKIFNEADYIGKYENIQKIQKYANGQPSQLFNISNVINSTIFTERNCDIMLSIGIQYSYINDENKKILSILTDNTTSTLNIDLYQNSINEYNSSTSYTNIFIPKEHNYAPGNNNNYHLLTLYKRYIYETDAPFYEIIVYLDGCPEGAFKNFVKDASCWSNIILNNANYSINFFELAYLKHDKNSLTRFDRNKTSNIIISNDITYLDDVAISEYYYKYVSSHKNLNSLIPLLENFHNFKETENGMIEVASLNDINAIANGINIPVLLFSYTEQSDNEFINWFTKSYKEGSLTKDEKRLDNLYYSTGLNKLSNIVLPEQLAGSYWFIALQGSSTGELFSKNLTLGIKNQSSGYMGIFTPNFYDIDSDKFNNYDRLTNDEKEQVMKAKSSFLPETAYTLKADVVDSSHSNNTAVGAFVNANTTQFDIKFDGGATNKETNKYVNYVKNCLLGFPVLIFMNVNRGGQSAYYYLGIYNFNLGRDSYFNMGYYSPRVLEQSQITTSLNGLTGNTFAVTYVSLNNEENSSLAVDNGVIVAEIQGGDDHFDFSQYHSTILLPQTVSQGKDSECMFGDFVPNYNPDKSTDEDLRIRYHIPRLVEAVSKAGGYIFQTILKKHLGEYKYGYNKYIDNGIGSSIFDSANQVPNYTLQYVRNPQENDTGLKFLIHNFVKENGQIKLVNGQPIIDSSYIAVEKDLGKLIDTNVDITKEDTYGRGDQPILEYSSLTEYYVTCMAFGLVDSVMKNLNVKSWNATYTGNANEDYKTGKWFVAFYDMDTSFGRDNGGGRTSYFAFSDYWKTNKTSDLEVPTIYRDFYPKEDPNNPYVSNQKLTESGFDIPSSYLFAVAKYTHLLYKDNAKMTPYIPHNIWARWRYVSSRTDPEILGPGIGELQSADYFINKYFIRNLDDIPEQLWALNYRFKYLKRIDADPSNAYNYIYDVSENGSFEDMNYIPFHGKGINELHEWLNGRLHILDAYFNLDGNNTLKMKYLDYKEKESEEPLNKFTPIIRLDEVKGYEYVDTEVPNTDSTGTYKWLDLGDYVEYMPGGDSHETVSAGLNSNGDIELLKDIFSTTSNGARYSQPIDLYVKAQAFSPLMIQEAQGGKSKYLLEDPSKEYHITYTPHGLQITKFGGSSLWTYIKNLNTIINEGSLTLNTESLDQIVLTRGKCSSYNISKVKSLKTISIIKDLYDSESKFTGQLNFIKSDTDEDPYPDLTTIELIRTEITLTVNGEGVLNINLTGTQTAQATNIVNCDNLENVTLTNFSAPSLTVTPGWSNNMVIDTTKITQMKLSPKNDTANERRITISNDSSVTNITLDKFTHITINNCPKLYNLCILHPEYVKSLEIIGCNTNTSIENKHNLNIYYNEINEFDASGQPIIPENNTIVNPDGSKSTIINLQPLINIESFKFNGTLGFNTIDASNTDGDTIIINGTEYKCIKLYTNAFSNTELERIITKPDVYLYINSDNINGSTETFANSGYGLYPNKFIIGRNVRKLNNLFSHELYGISFSTANITNLFALNFLNCDTNIVIFEEINNINSLSSIFYGQTKITLSNASLSLHNFKNVNDISYMLFGTSVSSFDKYKFGYENDYCGINAINNNEIFNLSCFIPTACLISEDLFDYYINNITNLISDNEQILYNLNISGYNNRVFKVSNLFSKLKYDSIDNSNILESFIGFNFDNNLQLDFEDLLYDHTLNTNKFPHLKSILASFISGNKNNINYNRIGTYELTNKLINTDNQIKLLNSFVFSVESKEKIIIDQIINFNNLPKNPILPWNEKCNSLTGAKQINEINLINILKILGGSDIDSKNCTLLNGLFSYTDIVIDETKENKNELILSDETVTVPYKFVSCIKLFDNAKFIDSENNVYGFEITQNTLKAFTNVINWNSAFANCILHKNLPLNMFNKKDTRYDSYLIDYYDHSIINMSSMFANVKIDSSETWFNYNWTTEDINKYNNGIALNGSYHANIKTFEDVVISNYKSKDNYTTNEGITIYGENIIHNLILPWDIFYGCTTICLIDNFIANSEFEGILPSNLFAGTISNLQPDNTFYNTLVIPNYITDIVIDYTKKGNTSEIWYTLAPAYVFIPKNFINSLYLKNAFNFKLLLPNSESIDYHNDNNSIDAPNWLREKTNVIENGGEENKLNASIELYFVLQTNSIKFGALESIKNFLPIDIRVAQMDENNNIKYSSLHDIDHLVNQNVEVGFSPRIDYGIHYYMYFNTNTTILSYMNDEHYPWIERIVKDSNDQDIITYVSLKRNSNDENNNSDTGLPIQNNIKLLYESIFNNEIISFCYGPIISTLLQLGSIQPISGANPFININDDWSNFSYNIVLPLNDANGRYYENVFNTTTITKTLSLRNIFRNSQKSLENYQESNKYIDIEY